MDFLRRMGPVTRNLLIINVIVFLFCLITPYSTTQKLIDVCALHYFASPGFGIWQLFTYMFVHVEFMHLFFNMFALVMFGTPIEYNLGPRRFLFYYLSCGVGAALIQEGVYAIMLDKYYTMFSPEQMQQIITEGWDAIRHGMDFTDPALSAINGLVNGPVIGASGAVYGILLAFAMMWPNMPLYIMFIPVPLKAKWVIVGYTVLELAMGLGVKDNVAHFAHLGGMLVGLLIILYWNRKHTFSRHF